jgi:hypothetical protein
MLGLNINLLDAAALVQKSNGRKLYGFEFMDIVTQPGRGSCMKKLKVDLPGKTWIGLVNVVDAVVVCAGLGNAITAADETGVRNKVCNQVPCHRDYLAATIPCINWLVKRRGGYVGGELKNQLLQIAKDTYWKLEENPFVDCDHDNNSGTCWERPHIFQQLITQWRQERFDWRNAFSKQQTAQPTTQTGISIPESGAVVFGTAIDTSSTPNKIDA